MGKKENTINRKTEGRKRSKQKTTTAEQNNEGKQGRQENNKNSKQ